MSRFSRWTMMVVISFLLHAGAASAAEPALQPATLRFDPQFILEAVARKMNVTLRPDVPVPEILLESTTPLRRFQDAIAAQWNFRPRVFANAYVVSRNEIYLMDSPAYYVRLRRTLDDSLAHELAHYIQVHYFSADLAEPSYELDAVAVQERFRDTHITPARVVTAGERSASAFRF